MTALRCVTGDKEIPGQGLYFAATLERSDGDLRALTTALRQRPGHVAQGTMCPMIAIVPPQVVLIAKDGTMVRPKFPVGGCDTIASQALRALNALPWHAVSVRVYSRVSGGTATPSAGATSDPQASDLIPGPAKTGVNQPGPGGPPASRRAIIGLAARRAARSMRSMAVRAVIFDWGGTLTPWHSVDLRALWAAACTPHFPAGQVASVAAALHAGGVGAVAAGRDRAPERDHRARLRPRRGRHARRVHARFLDAWAPHTYTDPDAEPLLRALRERGIKIGVLSNTMWPRSAHEDVFARDSLLGLIDGAVYTSEIPWTKPHPEAFRAAMAAVGEDDPAGVRVRWGPALR